MAIAILYGQIPEWYQSILYRIIFVLARYHAQVKENCEGTSYDA